MHGRRCPWLASYLNIDLYPGLAAEQIRRNISIHILNILMNLRFYLSNLRKRPVCTKILEHTFTSVSKRYVDTMGLDRWMASSVDVPSLTVNSLTAVIDASWVPCQVRTPLSWEGAKHVAVTFWCNACRWVLWNTLKFTVVAFVTGRILNGALISNDSMQNKCTSKRQCCKQYLKSLYDGIHECESMLTSGNKASRNATRKRIALRKKSA